MTRSTPAQPWRHRVRRHWPLLAVTVLLLALAVPAAFLALPGFLAPPPAAPAPTVPAWQQPPATLAAPGGLAPLTDAALRPDRAAVTAQLQPLLTPDGDGSFTGLVQDAITGDVLFDQGASAARVPASNLKLLTAVAALRTLGPDHRFSTTVVAGSNPNQVVLVGGGDVLLAAGDSAADQVRGRTGLATLAAQTATALAAAGAAGEITVALDDSLFSGPALNPAWDLGDVAAGEVAPLAPIALNAARFAPTDTSGARPSDPAITAAEQFASQLRVAGAAAGLTVAADVGRSPAPADAATLARAESATVAQQVDVMLQDSDNYLAEALGRLAAVASGRPGSNDGATDVVRAEVAAAGVDTSGLALEDVCGLAMGNRVSALDLVSVVRTIATGADDRLRAALAGFPVAGLTGTLDVRYQDPASQQGAGLVRAKTGTLNTVIALSGYVVDADGRLLLFSFIGNDLAPGAAGNKAAVDRAAAALAGCGCR